MMLMIILLLKNIMNMNGKKFIIIDLLTLKNMLIIKLNF